MHDAATHRRAILTCHASSLVISSTYLLSVGTPSQPDPASAVLPSWHPHNRCGASRKKVRVRVMSFQSPFRQCLLLGLICVCAFVPVRLFAADAASTAA